MKLYLFALRIWNSVKLTVEEFEVEEKQGVYTAPRRRFKKERVGVVSGWQNDECLLLENNPAKAYEAFIRRNEDDISNLENKIAKKRAEIEEMKSHIGGK